MPRGSDPFFKHVLSLFKNDKIIARAQIRSSLPVVIGCVPEAELCLPREGFERVGRRELALSLTEDGGELRIVRLRRLGAVEIDGYELQDEIRVGPGRHELALAGQVLTLLVEV